MGMARWLRSWHCLALIIHVTGVVPETKHWLLEAVLVAESAQACGSQHEIAAVAGRESEPARAEHAQQMPAREDEHVAGRTADAVDDAIGARTHVGRRLATRASVTEQLPARSLLQDLDRAAPLVFAVVP